MISKKALLILITLVTAGGLLPSLAEPAPVDGDVLGEVRSLVPGQTMGGSNIFLPVLSMPPIEQWIRNYPVSQNEYSVSINEMTFAPNGDIVWVGEGSAGQDSNALMGRVQSNGELLWLKGYGNGTPYHDSFSTIVPASTGGYWIGGRTRFDTPQKDYPLILRVDESGVILWQKIYMPSTPSPYGAMINQIVETNDNGLIMAINDFYSGVWITKLTENGTVSWVRTLGTIYNSFSITHMTIANDGSYVMVGTLNSGDGGLTWVIKMNSNGTMLWHHLYALSQVSTSTEEEPFGLVALNNGNYWVGVRTELVIQGQPNRAFWFIRLNGNGDVIDHKSFHNAPFDIPSMALTPEQDIVVVGRESYGGNARPWIFRISHNGTLSWRYFYGGVNGFTWPAASLAVQVSDAGDIYVGGTEHYQYDAGLMLMRLSPQGTVPDCDLFTMATLTSSTPGYYVETPTELPRTATLSVMDATTPSWNLTGQTIEICPETTTNLTCGLPE